MEGALAGGSTVVHAIVMKPALVTEQAAPARKQRRSVLGNDKCVRGLVEGKTCPEQNAGRFAPRPAEASLEVVNTSGSLVSTPRKRWSDASGRPERGCSSLKNVGCRRRSEMPSAAPLTTKVGSGGLVRKKRVKLVDETHGRGRIREV